MAETVAPVTVRLEADTQPFTDALSNLEKLAGSFGRQLTGALASATASGKSLDDMLPEALDHVCDSIAESLKI